MGRSLGINTPRHPGIFTQLILSLLSIHGKNYLPTLNMKFIVAALCLASVAYAADMGMNIAGGAYNFGYNTGDAGGHSRVESGHGGTVAGSYSYIDANGDRRTVQYTAGPDGFKATGDTGVDRKTAAEAAAIAALAPKAPVPAVPVAPVASWYHAPAWHYAPYVHHGLAGYAARW